MIWNGKVFVRSGRRAVPRDAEQVRMWNKQSSAGLFPMRVKRFRAPREAASPSVILFRPWSRVVAALLYRT